MQLSVSTAPTDPSLAAILVAGATAPASAGSAGSARPAPGFDAVLDDAAPAAIVGTFVEGEEAAAETDIATAAPAGWPFALIGEPVVVPQRQGPSSDGDSDEPSSESADGVLVRASSERVTARSETGVEIRQTTATAAPVATGDAAVAGSNDFAASSAQRSRPGWLASDHLPADATPTEANSDARRTSTADGSAITSSPPTAGLAVPSGARQEYAFATAENAPSAAVTPRGSGRGRVDTSTAVRPASDGRGQAAHAAGSAAVLGSLDATAAAEVSVPAPLEGSDAAQRTAPRDAKTVTGGALREWPLTQLPTVPANGDAAAMRPLPDEGGAMNGVARSNGFQLPNGSAEVVTSLHQLAPERAGGSATPKTVAGEGASSQHAISAAIPSASEASMRAPAVISEPRRNEFATESAVTVSRPNAATTTSAVPANAAVVASAAPFSASINGTSNAASPVMTMAAHATATSSGAVRTSVDGGEAVGAMPRVREAEKIAVSNSTAEVTPRAGKMAPAKTFVSVGEQILAHLRQQLGTVVADSVDAMPSAVLLPQNPGAHDAVASTGALAATEVSFDLSPEPGVTPETLSTAHRAVEAVLTAVHRFNSKDHHAVNLQFTVGGSDLTVRVEMRADEVRATFTTDSSELRAALAHEWNSAQSGAPERSVRLAPPTFASSDGSQAGAFNGHQFSRQRDSSARGSGEPFAVSTARTRGSRGADIDPTPAPAVRAPHRSSRHLHTLA